MVKGIANIFIHCASYLWHLPKLHYPFQMRPILIYMLICLTMLIVACNCKQVTAISIEKVTNNCDLDKNGDDHITFGITLFNAENEDIGINRPYKYDGGEFNIYMASKWFKSGFLKLRLTSDSPDRAKAGRTTKIFMNLDIERLRTSLNNDGIATDEEILSFIKSKNYYVVLTCHDKQISVTSKNETFNTTCVRN